MKKNKGFIIFIGILWTVLVAMVYAYEFIDSVLKIKVLPETTEERWKLILFVGFLITIVSLYVKGYLSIGLNFSGSPKVKPKFSVIDEIYEAEKNEQFENVISLGTTICRTLYIQGHHKLRHDIGKLIQEAAVKTQNRDAEIEAYIDYIGWSLVLMRGIDNGKAIKYINHGIDIAKNSPEKYFWIAKGIRHLGAIDFISHDIDSAVKKLNEAKVFADSIPDSNQKKEMIAGIDFDLALIKLKLNEMDASLSYCNESRKLREEVGDKSRICRMFALEGKIAEAKNDNISAKNYFSQGLEYSLKQKRKDEVIRNHIGLARILRDDDPEKAKKHLDLAKNILNTTDCPIDIYCQEEIPLL